MGEEKQVHQCSATVIQLPDGSFQTSLTLQRIQFFVRQRIGISGVVFRFPVSVAASSAGEPDSFATSGSYKPGGQSRGLLQPVAVFIERHPGLLEAVGSVARRKPRPHSDSVHECLIPPDEFFPRASVAGNYSFPNFRIAVSHLCLSEGVPESTCHRGEPTLRLSVTTARTESSSHYRIPGPIKYTFSCTTERAMASVRHTLPHSHSIRNELIGRSTP